MKKVRKPRGRKVNGSNSYDLCPGCYAFRCDPSSMSAKFREKVEWRIAHNVCVACGHNPCECKSIKFLHRAGVN